MVTNKLLYSLIDGKNNNLGEFGLVECGENNINTPELLLKPSTYHHGHFLAATSVFISFSQWLFLWGHTL